MKLYHFKDKDFYFVKSKPNYRGLQECLAGFALYTGSEIYNKIEFKRIGLVKSFKDVKKWLKSGKVSKREFYTFEDAA